MSVMTEKNDVSERKQCFSCKCHVFMPPTLKKLMGHIAFGASVRAWVGACVGGCVTLFVPTVTFKPLKLESD